MCSNVKRLYFCFVVFLFLPLQADLSIFAEIFDHFISVANTKTFIGLGTGATSALWLFSIIITPLFCFGQHKKENTKILFEAKGYTRITGIENLNDRKKIWIDVQETTTKKTTACYDDSWQRSHGHYYFFYFLTLYSGACRCARCAPSTTYWKLKQSDKMKFSTEWKKEKRRSNKNWSWFYLLFQLAVCGWCYCCRCFFSLGENATKCNESHINEKEQQKMK